MMLNSKGFTNIEIAILLVVVGLLLAFFVSILQGIKTREEKCNLQQTSAVEGVSASCITHVKEGN
jgi:type II secretory pathway pseudopilin PulG